MAKKKRKAKNQHAASKKPNAGHQEKGKKIEDFARAAFQKRSNQFQGSGTGIREVFEGLDFDQDNPCDRMTEGRVYTLPS